MKTRVALLLVLAAVLAACAPRAPEAPAPAPPASTSPHFAHGEELRRLMLGLRRFAPGRLPQELGPRLDRRSMERFADGAHELEAAARLLPGLVQGDELDPGERELFASMARTLAEAAAAASRAAAEGDRAAVEGSARAIESACDACHVRFRDDAGARLRR